MTKIIPLAAALLVALSGPASAAVPQKPKATPTRALANLATYVTDADYPEEAIRNGERGTVGFALDIGADGRPTRCSVTSSSGSSILDATTCRIMTERPRFEPARDRRGRPTTDRLTARLTWKLPTSEPQPQLDAAFRLWTSCVMGEAAKLVPGDLPAREVTRRSFPPCAALEALITAESKSAPMDAIRGSIAGSIEKALLQTRAVLNSPPAPAAAELPKPQQ